MHKLILFIKTFYPDFARVQALVDSIARFNEDDLPVYISVNDEDYSYFVKHLSGKFTLLKDQDIVRCTIKDGWRYQQVIKSSVYKLGICENYLCIDSDSLFLRPFSLSDFMFDADTPYTVMHEGKAFLEMMEVLGKDSDDLFRIKASKATKALFGNAGKHWDWGPSPYLWSTKVWQHFNEVYLANTGMNFETFFTKMEETALPSEAVIYGEYLLKTKLIAIMPVEGFFKVYHYKEQFQLEEPNFSIDRLRKNYMGVIMQSNWYDADSMPVKIKSGLANWFKR